MAGDVNDPDLYGRLAEQVGGNVLFYLATQPSQYEEIAQGLGHAGVAKGDGWRRLVVEKPFGHDLASARELSERLHEYFPESEVYRIDHYLGKETVQNILAFRFGNGIFEPLWNRRYVNHVQITGAESIGVEGRGAYYQEAGALRDMIQNHLLQVMATVAMEPSASFRPIRCAMSAPSCCVPSASWKPEEVLQNAVPGQYGPARIGGEDVPGFRQEQGVDPNSQTDTYAAVTVLVDNWRWAGVPFYMRTGKRLPKRVSEIAIQFNEAPLQIFNHDDDGDVRAPNLLILRIQPEEGISLKFVSKRPGDGHEAAAGLDGFQLRFELRRAVAGSLRNVAARRDDRRCHALHAAGHGGGELGGGGADPEGVGRDEVRFPELPGGIVGTEGRRRNAGAPRPRLEAAMSATVSPERILQDLSNLVGGSGAAGRRNGIGSAARLHHDAAGAVRGGRTMRRRSARSSRA